MSFLNGMFGKKQDDARGGAGTMPARDDCPHLALTPRWDSADDIGHEDRASGFVCDACHQTLTLAEAEQSRRSAADRLRTE
jgi:hypothetical protein